MHTDPDRQRAYSTFEDAVRDQRTRCAPPIPNPLFVTSAVYGVSPATCPDCQPKYVCPFHRTH